ncbi:MAG TPA: hypothetical protein VD928_03725 [Candidatus Paceibacterota bacterium]|nr:hypothetical protein [Candidatus Paceibacterota bacterium]
MHNGTASHKELRNSLPHAHMVFPDELINRVKYYIWRVYTPYHPFFRDLAIKLRLVSITKKVERFGARQRYLLGTIAPNETVEGVIEHLLSKGYGNHFVAWEDDGEVVSLRYVENFKYQYHLRIFEDGEVRGHYEFTTECHPLKHFYEIGFEDRREHFLSVLGDKITPVQTS